MAELFIKVKRDKKSYTYKRYPDKPDDWGNNDFNNMLDFFEVYVYEACIFTAKCQTVANIPNGRFLDTIIPSPFKMKCFVGEGEHADSRNFYGRIHGICDTWDMEGQWINENSIEVVKGKDGAPVDFTRWLVHDLQKHKPEKPGVDTRVAWSAGCIVMSDSNLSALGRILDACKILPGTFIDGVLLEV